MTYVIALAFLIGSALSMMAAFKGAELADDLGLQWVMWMLLVACVSLSVFLAYHGVSFLLTATQNPPP